MGVGSRGQAGGRTRRANSVDVAREAGVSRATVSYVLNDNPHQSIPEETRDRVLRAAERLRYAPSAAARTLSRGRSDIVLYLLPPHLRLNTQFGDLLEHLSTHLAHAGLTLVVHPWSQELRPLTAIWSALSPVAVLAQQLTEDDINAMHAAGVQLVHSMLTAGDTVSQWVHQVQHEICGRQVDALAAAGHRQLGYAMPTDPRLHAEINLRMDGVRAACADRGLPEPFVHPVLANAADATAAVTAFRDHHPPVTGVCCYDDTTALALAAGLRTLGLSAPHDLAVVGVYDIPAAALADPPLTTVYIDSAAMAGYVAAALLNRLAGQPDLEEPGPRVTRLIQRRSG